MQALRSLAAHIAPHPWRAIWTVFALLLLAGYVGSDDYGLSMDEGPLYAFAQEVWRYLFEGGKTPVTADWKFHTPVYQMLFIAVMKVWPPMTDLDLLVQRRIITFLTFCIGWWATLFLARRVSSSWWWALLAAVWMALSPRVFAHGFYNPKDLPTLSFFALSVLLLVRSLERPTALRVALFGLVAGFTVSLRPFGLLLPVFALAAAVAQAAGASGEQRRRWSIVALAYPAATVLLMIAVWPRLWSDPLTNLYGAFLNNVSRGDEGFYMGSHLSAFPWHYLFVWIGITTPVSYTALFLTGFAVTLTAAVKRPLEMLRESPVAALTLPWVALPILGKLTGKIGLFDEWRHVLFLYPAMLLLALVGAQWLWARTRGHLRTALAVVVVANTLWTGVWMVRHHALEYLYFSVPSSWVEGRVEMDYWGLSHREGLRWIAAHDDRPKITVYLRDHVGVGAVHYLPPDDSRRIVPVRSPALADYIVDTLRWTHYEHVVPVDRIVHTLTIDGLPFLWIYRGPFASDRYPVYNYL